MTHPRRRSPMGLYDRSRPEGWPVGSFDSYADAQAAVDMLSDTGDFPVDELSIVGFDLMEVEQVTGRLTWPKVLGGGALSGAWMGLFVGLLMSFFSPNSLGPVLVGLIFGLVFGIVSASVPYVMSRGKRDFTTATRIVAGRYDVICDPAHARQARDAIARFNMSHGRLNR